MIQNSVSSARLHLYLLAILGMTVCIVGHALAEEMGRADALVESRLSVLKNGSMCERRQAVVALHKLGKAAIPALVSHIGDADRATKSTLLLQNPMLSYVFPDSIHDEFSGVIAAYLIELILGQRSLVSDTVGCGFRGGNRRCLPP